MPLSAQSVDPVRRRITALFLGGVGIGATGFIAAQTASTLAAEAISGQATWSGLPPALAIFGTATGTTILAAAMQRWGRRRGLLAAYGLAALGAFIAISALIRSSLGWLVVGLFTIGLGRSGESLSRYLVADLYPVGRRASAIGWMVWVGTVGAVLGPNSLGPSARVATAFHLPELTGPYLVTLAAYVVVAFLYFAFLRPDPATLVDDDSLTEPSTHRGGLADLLRSAAVRIALTVLVTGQVVMLLIMSMTPLYLKGAGHDLRAIGFVMSSHIVGMFILSPLTGRLVDRWGRLPVIVLGQLMLLVAALGAPLAPSRSVPLIATALFLLGLGWNFGFVAGSALLSSGLPADRRARLQGTGDSLVWGSAALASVVSGVILSTLGYTALCLLGALLLLAPATVLLRHRAALATLTAG